MLADCVVAVRVFGWEIEARAIVAADHQTAEPDVQATDAVQSNMA